MDSNNSYPLEQISTKALVEFGLNRQPFIDRNGLGALFEDSALSTQINVMINMLHGSDKILLITGEEGVGKTSLLYRIGKTSHDGLFFCYIKAVEGLTVDEICREALKKMEIVAPGIGNEIKDFFASKIAAKRKMDGKTILILDNADKLDSYTLDQLLLLRNIVSEDGISAFSVVLSGGVELQDTINGLPRISGHPGVVHNVCIYPLSEKQTGQYLMQRLDKAGNSNVDLLSPAQIKSIHERSRGIPRLVNIEAAQILNKISEKVSSKQNKSKENKNNKPANKLFIYGATTVLVVVSAVFAAIKYPGFIKPRKIAGITVSENKDQIRVDGVVTKPDNNKPLKNVKKTVRKRIYLTEKKDSETIIDAKKAEEVMAADTLVKDGVQGSVSEIKKEEVKTEVETAKVKGKEKPEQVVVKVSSDSEGYLEGNKPQKKNLSSKSVSENTSVSDENSKETEKDINKKTEKTVTNAKTDVEAVVNKKTETNAENKKGEEIDIVKNSKKIKNAVKVKDKPEENLVESIEKPATIKTDSQKEAAKVVKADIKTELDKQKPAEKAAKESSKVKSSKKPDTYHYSWAMSQKRGHYTIQYLASPNKTSVIEYRNKYKILKSSRIMKISRKGKIWYILVMDRYETNLAARNFIKKLPDSIREDGPWIRSFASLQKAVVN